MRYPYRSTMLVHFDTYIYGEFRMVLPRDRVVLHPHVRSGRRRQRARHAVNVNRDHVFVRTDHPHKLTFANPGVREAAQKGVSIVFGDFGNATNGDITRGLNVAQSRQDLCSRRSTGDCIAVRTRRRVSHHVIQSFHDVIGHRGGETLGFNVSGDPVKTQNVSEPPLEDAVSSYEIRCRSAAAGCEGDRSVWRNENPPVALKASNCFGHRWGRYAEPRRETPRAHDITFGVDVENAFKVAVDDCGPRRLVALGAHDVPPDVTSGVLLGWRRVRRA